jgi:hypothetical protein
MEEHISSMRGEVLLLSVVSLVDFKSDWLLAVSVQVALQF